MKLTKVSCIALLLAVLYPGAKAQTNYCDPSLCDSGVKHIACNNAGAFSSKCDASAKIMTLTPQIRQAIVKKHNTLRNKVAKGGFSGFKLAVRMATMRWNDELAKLAVFNVKQCVMEHEPCHNTKKFKWSGQNLASGGTTASSSLQKTVLDNVQLWFNEYKYATAANIRNVSAPSNGKVIGHFTEMMLEKNTDVGCAVLRQKRGTDWEFFTACNYAYINVLGMPTYRTGQKVAGQCKTGKNPNFKNLCSLKEKYTYTP